MSVDLIIHSGTKFALEQWLSARFLGTLTQDTDATSPTFGSYFYEHTAEGSLLYWNHPSGVITKTINNTDPDNIISTQYNGFYARLSFPTSDSLTAPRYNVEVDLETGEDVIVEKPSLSDWVNTSTAVSVLDGISGIGGEGITILDPTELYEVLASNGVPVWGGIIGVSNDWSDPSLWAYSNVMIGDEREFNGIIWESLIDFNVWSPSQYPQGWLEIGEVIVEPPVDNAPAEWVQPVGAVDAYTLGSLVTYNGQVWLNTGSNANVWAPGVFGWVLQ